MNEGKPKSTGQPEAGEQTDQPDKGLSRAIEDSAQKTRRLAKLTRRTTLWKGVCPELRNPGSSDLEEA